MNESRSSRVRYEPDDKLPAPLALGLGLQFAVLCLTGIVLTPAIVIRAGGGGDSYLAWAVFAAVGISGICTILQAARLGRIGSGHVLVMGTSATFIAVCIAALAKGGPGLMASLVVASSLFQFALSRRLSLLRRILTPAVSGTVIMLIAATVMPIAFGMLSEVPEHALSAAAPASALVTIAAICLIALRGNAILRLWAPVIGVIGGGVAAAWFGLYDFSRVASAAWFGLPDAQWPGLDLSLGPAFWALLPAFVFATLVGATETIGDALAIQRVSRREPRAADFRAVQGAVSADGVGNLLSGLAGTVPNTTYSTSVSVTELTGVGARSVGVAAGCVFIVAALLPKLLALILAIPAPVVGAYIIFLLAMLFIVGVKLVLQEGMNYRNGLVCGVSFWVGTAFQAGAIAPEFFSDFAGGMLENGVTALPLIMKFLRNMAKRSGWDEAMSNRLEAAGEETLLTLLDQPGDRQRKQRRLLLIARKDGDGAMLEFIAAPGGGNLEDRIAHLAEQTSAAAPEHQLSLRLLRGLSSSVHHQQYHDTDIITVRVDAPRPAAAHA